MFTDAELTDRAFSAGCDARLRGEPLESCPHRSGTKTQYQFRRGWKDVDLHWNRDSRLPGKALPAVAK